MYPMSKGDLLCPLGFHPQVRWPTRCKRCFRDYKEHGNKKCGDEITASTPALSESQYGRQRDNGKPFERKAIGRTWTSTQNLSILENNDQSNIKI